MNAKQQLNVVLSVLSVRLWLAAVTDGQTSQILLSLLLLSEMFTGHCQFWAGELFDCIELVAQYKKHSVGFVCILMTVVSVLHIVNLYTKKIEKIEKKKKKTRQIEQANAF